LEPPEAVRVGVHRADGEFAPLPIRPLEPETQEEATGAEPSRGLRVHIKLGPDIVVERGQQVKVQLAGELEQVSANGESRLTGRIELKGGKLDVQGKTFDIERGVVTLDGSNPPNPTITATARWDSPAGYTVYAEYAGTAKNGEIRLRSEPPLTQDEIASLILFGAPDGTVGAGSGSGGDGNAAMAVGVAGDTAAKGLNQALSRFTDLDVTARIDTSTGSARPEIVVQVTPRLTARITRAIGEPAPGQSPDRTFLTLELRLRQAWSLLARVGDRGASTLDLIWRKRY
jgi:translocation and assembly module TamB